MKPDSTATLPDALPRLTTARALLLLWLAGNALRITILAVPPVLATIRDDLALSATQVGLLSSIPPALFAIAALLGSLLVTRLGLKQALVGGLAVVAIGSALRGWSSGYATLFAATVVMSAGIAIMQPIMPTAVRQWTPHNIPIGTAIYTNGLLVGEILPVMFATSLVLPLVGGSWRWSLLLWSLPIAVIALVVMATAPRDAAVPRPAAAGPMKWLPDWHSGLVWRLGLLFCCFNATYFSTNAFLPIYLAHAQRSDLIGPALTSLNFSQLPASLLLLALARRVERKGWAYIACGAVSLVGIAGIVVDIGARTILWTALVGFANAAALIMGLTLPPLLCKRDDVARTAAGTFTISYGLAVAFAVIAGALWDLTGIAWTSFVPIALASVALIVIAVAMRRKGELV